jgi:hypothetical protein
MIESNIFRWYCFYAWERLRKDEDIVEVTEPDFDRAIVWC